MLRKVELPEMAATDHLAQLLGDIADLEVKGKEAAFSFFTINHLTSTRESAVTGIIHKLFAIVGVIPALRNLLTTPDSPLLSPKQLETLSQHITSCHSILTKVEAAVREADDWVGPYSSKNRAEAPKSFYPRGELNDAKSIVTTCFHDMVVVISAARAEHLARFGYL